MKNILIVDDEETLLLVIVSRFKNYRDRFKVSTARNGKEAVKILEAENIDLVVTDLNMPEMDGFELLVYMNNNFPSIPVIVNSAYCTSEIQAKLNAIGTMRLLDKAVDFDLLLEAVMQELEDLPTGSIRGISTSGFLQMIELEQKSCLLEVQSPGQPPGHLYIVQGDIYDAACGDSAGEDAAYRVIGWDNVQLFMKELPTNRIQKRIGKSTMAVVMESLRRKDETEMALKQQSAEPVEPAPKSAAKAETAATPEVVLPTPETDDGVESAPSGDEDEKVISLSPETGDGLVSAPSDDEDDTFSCDLNDILALFNESNQPEKTRKTSGSGKSDQHMTTGESDTSTSSNRIPPTGNFSRQKTALETAAQIKKVLGVSSVDLDKVLKFALKRIRTILNVEAGHVYLREKDQMRTAMAFDTKDRSMKKVQFKVGQGIAGRAVALGKTILVNDDEKSSRLYREIDRQADFAIRSALCIPLLSQEEIIGVVEVLNKIEGNFDADDKKLLQPISDAISSALQHFQADNNRAPARSA